MLHLEGSSSQVLGGGKRFNLIVYKVHIYKTTDFKDMREKSKFSVGVTLMFA